MRGASAVQQLLDRYPKQKLIVLIVWEPILLTDWTSPSRSTLARVSDPRARQFWDPQHLVAEQVSRMAKVQTSVPGPDCCKEKGFDWDEAILYASRTQWKYLRVPAFWNGPVYRVIPGLEKALRERP